ncbi:hypothetical protein BURKHO8Y_160053 [Burkholderia sp. 8Y]|nr:hypothetical protein BURKHO8Y_160053 [Burkholderia sp. 8Y]
MPTVRSRMDVLHALVMFGGERRRKRAQPAVSAAQEPPEQGDASDVKQVHLTHARVREPV